MTGHEFDALHRDELDALVEASVRRREHERRIAEEQRAAAARSAAYRDNGAWDDAGWWAQQLGRAVQLREVAPPL